MECQCKQEKQKLQEEIDTLTAKLKRVKDFCEDQNLKYDVTACIVLSMLEG